MRSRCADHSDGGRPTFRRSVERRVLVMMSSIRLRRPETRMELEESRSDELDEAWVLVDAADSQGIARISRIERER